MSMEPTNAPPARAGGKKKMLPVGLIVLAVMGITCLSGLGLVGAGMMFQQLGKPLEVTPEDRALLVTAEDLEARMESFKVKPQVEKLTKKRGLDGTIDLEYEYDQTQSGMYLMSSVSTDRTESSASTTYASLKVGHGVGFSVTAGKETKMEERDDLFAWGDESRTSIITHNDKPVGNVFITRKGRHVFTFIVVGAYFSSQETMADLLQPKMERLAQLP